MKHSNDFKEFNLLDTVISDNIHNPKLKNDVYDNELKNDNNSNTESKRKPTPVAVATIRGGKKIEKSSMIT